ncbi:MULTISPECIES: HNH endonuclease [unclassified Streptomyces]|uniref:HNH endonuclease n=1 Tax=unclassified Streptomyces TaxID=2593676 RepID=UPI003BB5BC65
MSGRVNGVRKPHQRRRLVRQIAARPGHGRRCFYCQATFHGMEGITFDHYVPYSLWRTGRHDALVLACYPCNQGKGDRLPWPLVWLLLASPGRRATATSTGASTGT